MRDASIQVKGDEYDGYRNTVIIINNIVNMGILLMLCSITPPQCIRVATHSPNRVSDT